jgi:hypothetical protein
MWAWPFTGSFAAKAARSTILEKPGALSGARRSETNTKGDFALSRLWRRSSRSSRPVSGCVAGDAVLDPTDTQGRGFEVYPFPAQVHPFGSPYAKRTMRASR